MPGNAEGRLPGKEAASNANSPTTSSADDSTEPESIAAQLRRRRESKRLPPLSNGKRDPWDLERYYDWTGGA